MLVFAVLLDPSGVTHNDSGILVIHKPEHQVPLALLRVDGTGQFDGVHAVVNSDDTHAGRLLRLESRGFFGSF